MAQRTERSTVVGVFEQRTQAERAVDELRRAGFRDEQIGIATQGGEAAGGGTAPGEVETRTGEGAVTGAITGGVLGGLLGAAASLLIPGIGPVLAGGILATTLGGAALGAAAGGLLGALTEMGVPEEEARYYEGEFRSGRTLVTVKANGRYQEAADILYRNGAYDAHVPRGTAPRTEHTTRAFSTASQATVGTDVGRRAEGEERVQLREEELRARKEMVETGEVEVRKDVVTEQRTIEVPVQREEVVIERHPVAGREASDRPIGEVESIRVPVREEEVTVEKRPVVREEIEIGKRPVTETEQVSGTVRREEVRIDREGDVNVRGAGTGSTMAAHWEDVGPRYRSNWQQRFGTQGGRWEDYEPSYRYGWEMASRPEYRGRSWTEVEPELRRDWETRYRDRPWNRAADAIRDAWVGATR